MSSVKKIASFVGIYIGLRIFSLIFQPITPLHEAHIVNTLCSALLLLIVIILLIKKNILGWYIITGELILGGAGGYFGFFTISLRTLLLITSVSIFFLQQGKNILELLKKYHTFIYLLILLLGVVFIAIIRGYLFKNDLHIIIADSIPYLFFFYFFPLQSLINSKQFRTTILYLVYAALIGNYLFILVTFTGFSLHIFNLQNQYYHWYRDVSLGKVTDAGINFFRIVINEHLLLIPIFLFFFANLLNQHYLSIKRNFLSFIPFVSMVILAINLTRIYIIALGIGIIATFKKIYWKNWLVYSFTAFIIFFVSFVSINLLLSHGKSYGLELLGLRIHSITRPNIEDSSLSRLLLLPKIEEKIKKHPFLGNGLGTSLVVYSPVFKEEITTTQFDWGYFEILAELGGIGLLAWSLIIGYVFKKIAALPAEMKRPLLVSFVALLLINITSPALFHVFGVLWIVFLLSYFHQKLLTEGEM